MGGELNGQDIDRQDALAHGVGEGNFGGGNQVLRGFALVATTDNMEQVFTEFGQLAGANKGTVADDIRGVALGVAMLAGVGVEHKLRQGAVQTGGLAFH